MIHSPSALVVPHTVKGWEFIEIDGVICLSHKLLGANLNVNATTGLVLEQCNGFDSVDTIVKSLVERFPDYANEIKIDVLAVFARLAQEGVISFRIKQSNELLTAIRDRRANPFYYFDAIFCINLDSAKSRWHQAKNQYKLLGIEERVTRFSAVETPQNHHVGCALSHRRIIQKAMEEGLQNILVLEDDAMFDVNSLENLANNIGEIGELEWDVLHLGGCYWGTQHTNVAGCVHLKEVTEGRRGPTTTHAVAYNKSVYTNLLEKYPESTLKPKDYIDHPRRPAIDQYLSMNSALKRLLISPSIASQPGITGQEAESFKPLLSLNL